MDVLKFGGYLLEVFIFLFLCDLFLFRIRGDRIVIVTEEDED